MDRQQRITEKLRETLTPSVLEVENESHGHNVPKGSETHFRVTVVAPQFEGKGPVARHKLVYAALGEELAKGLHALAITARTPAEWDAQPAANESPRCHGGGK
jgi:stress-induced morphogen